MKQIGKIIKKYFVLIIIMIGLVSLQAMCDLKLPDYTSNIVNIGIQQNGIDSTAIKVIRKNEFDKLKVFIKDKDLNSLKDNYTLIKKNDKNYKDKYKILSKEDIYVLNDNADISKVESILTRPLALSINLEQIKIVNIPEYQNYVANLDITADATLSDVLPLMPEEVQKIVLEQINERFSTMEDSLLKQSAIEYIKREYKAVGINTETLQTDYIKSTGIKMLGVSLAAMAIIIITCFISSKVASRFSKEMRSSLVNKVLKFSNKEFEKFSSSSLITRSTNDIQQIQMLIVLGFRIIIYAPIIGIGAFLKVSSNEMGWVIGIAVLVILMLVGTLFVVTIPKFQKVQDLIDKLNLVFREILMDFLL